MTAKVEIDEFTQQYIETFLWAEGWSEDSDATEDTPYDETFKPVEESFDPDAWKLILHDCKKFQEDNAELLEQVDDITNAGHDFWLTRQGHGCGFWDGDYEEKLGEALTEACKKFGEAYHYVSDGKIYMFDESVEEIQDGE